MNTSHIYLSYRKFYEVTLCRVMLIRGKPTLKVLNFAGIKFRDFCDFWSLSRNFVPAKLNICRIWDSFFSKYLIKVWYWYPYIIIFTYSNEIAVAVKYLITITLINNRKTGIQWGFYFLFPEIAKLNTREICNHQIAKLNTQRMYFFNREIKYHQNLIPLN